MSWLRLEGTLFSHRKVVALSKDAKLLFVGGLAYSVEQLTDGILTAGAVRAVGGLLGVKAAARSELADVRLWHPFGHDCDGEHCKQQPPKDGYLIHDYLVYQPTGDEMRAKRNHLSEVRAKAGRIGGQRSAEARRQPNGEAPTKQTAKQTGSSEPSSEEAPNPNPNPSVSYPDPQLGVGAVDNGVGLGDLDQEDLVLAVASTCIANRRDLVDQQAPRVVDFLLKHVDRRLVEEAVTQARTQATGKPKFPKWFMKPVRARAADYGIAVPFHPEFDK